MRAEGVLPLEARALLHHDERNRALEHVEGSRKPHPQLAPPKTAAEVCTGLLQLQRLRVALSLLCTVAGWVGRASALRPVTCFWGCLREL